MTEVDDIQSFIAAQKRRIEEERAGLTYPSTSRQNVSHQSHGMSFKVATGNGVPTHEQSKASKEDISSPSGLPLGSYEIVQEKLRKERAEEYNKFLAEKNFRSTGLRSPGNNVEKLPAKSALKKDPPELPRTSRTWRDPGSLLDDVDKANMPRARRRPEKTLDELYDAYEELLERKRQDERRYRGVLDDPYLDSRHVRFDDESRLRTQKEPWLSNGVRRRWGPPDTDIYPLSDKKGDNADHMESRTYEDYQTRRKNLFPDERISRSAPPTAVPIFGEHDMSPEVKHQRQVKYREELEAQIKEREMQKKREKNPARFASESRTQQESSYKSQVNGEMTDRNYGSSFSPNNYPVSGIQDLTLHRYEPPLRDEHALRLNQFGYGQPYNHSYFNQPINGPPLSTLNGPSTGLPLSAFDGRANGLPLSALNPSPGTVDMLPTSLRNPYGGYQPSWANDPMLGQRTSGLVTRLGEIGAVAERHSQFAAARDVNRGVENGASNAGLAGVGALPYGDSSKDKTRSKQLSYREELTRQIAEKETRKKKDKEEVERYNMKLEREIEEYNPWGKAGGGAPIRDESGKLVSDLRMMHQYNKEGTIISPRDRGKKVQTSFSMDDTAWPMEIKKTVSSPARSLDQFKLSAPQQIEKDVNQRNPQQEYKDFLRQQVEEKQRKKKEEEERQREIEARQDKVIEEQQRKLREEYEKELEAAKRKEAAVREQNEKIRKEAEQRKKEMEQKRLEEDRKQEEKLRKELDERLKAAKGRNTNPTASPPVPTAQNAVRSNSPPIPTLQRKTEGGQGAVSPLIPTLGNEARSDSPPIPTLQKKKPDGGMSFEKDTSRRSPDPYYDRKSGVTLESSKESKAHERNESRGLRSRPSSVTADIDVLSQLTSLRRQLKKEERKVQQELSENKEKYVKLRENSAARRNKKPVGNVFDNVLRKQPTTSPQYLDAQTSGAVEEFNKLKYEETSSLQGDFLSRYPEPATTGSTLDLQQKSLLREQQKRLEAFCDSVRLTDKENVDSLGNRVRPPSSTSLLQSESQFIPINGSSQVTHGESSKQSPRTSSARERRRWKQLENLAKASKLSDYKPPTPGGFSLNSVTSFNLDEVAQKNEDRLRRLEAMNQARSESKGDPDEVLKRFIQQHSRPDSKVSENSLPADKQYLPSM